MFNLPGLCFSFPFFVYTHLFVLVVRLRRWYLQYSCCSPTTTQQQWGDISPLGEIPTTTRTPMGYSTQENCYFSSSCCGSPTTTQQQWGDISPLGEIPTTTCTPIMGYSTQENCYFSSSSPTTATQVAVGYAGKLLLQQQCSGRCYIGSSWLRRKTATLVAAFRPLLLAKRDIILLSRLRRIYYYYIRRGRDINISSRWRCIIIIFVAVAGTQYYYYYFP